MRIVEGIEGSVPIRMELVIRFGYGEILPWVRRIGEDDACRHRRAGRAHAANADAGARREPSHRVGVHCRGRGASLVRPDVVSVTSRARRLPEPIDPDAGARGHLLVLARVARELHVQGPLAGVRAALADHAEGAHLPAHRRHRGGADDVSPGADRRHPELGLPLLLAARRDVRARRAARVRLPRRGARRGAAGCCERSRATRTTSRSCTAPPASGA